MLNNFIQSATIKGLGIVAGADANANIATPFAKAQAAIQSVAKEVSNIAPYVALLCFVIIGVMWMSGQRGSQLAKSWVGKVITGIAIVVLAVLLVNWVVSIFGGTSNVNI
ncbi:TrbC/VirB2 family protein [Lactobacillus taiwanensis]|uniref:TrbC/VirB2 family protein n=1 Tax=Lactobacillus taiwanensis TaxID=508451 RepID=UPI00242D5ECB|nr:TrbC/VirB2 family protein [Lactobacillus taiwanensis]